MMIVVCQVAVKDVKQPEGIASLAREAEGRFGPIITLMFGYRRCRACCCIVEMKQLQPHKNVVQVSCRDCSARLCY